MHPIRLISFGYCTCPPALVAAFPGPPAVDRIEDVRDRLRGPAAACDIFDLDGLSPRVENVVLGTPGARELVANLADLPAGPGCIAIGARRWQAQGSRTQGTLVPGSATANSG
ncbi:hypothetical protein KBP30_40680 [Streptomyces sp. Go40/10]|uniref:hypothetical protein n=1 Tax=Streptomyces sp. Go40/10 TaxID=2825844 RepID=UPI001E3BDB98|nr:hypothetical protein [Streptomyces sp. Go40/10]UFR07073.1 hypothetical protein KBP30_40680 [Streptomyces sp. Go40/10]